MNSPSYVTELKVFILQINLFKFVFLQVNELKFLFCRLYDSHESDPSFPGLDFIVLFLAK